MRLTAVIVLGVKYKDNLKQFIMSDVIGAVFATIVIFAVLAIILAIPTFFLWNWLLPALFGITKISFVQAIGINFLTGILFKSTVTNTSNK